MKQESSLVANDISDDDMEEGLNSVHVTEDIVEDFARQLDQVVRIQNEDESEDESEMEDNFGYQQLPQDEDDESETMYQQLESDEEDSVEQDSQANNPLDIELEISERLNTETSDLIKSIMSNIQLSDEATPEWAKKLPERVWLPRIRKQE